MRSSLLALPLLVALVGCGASRKHEETAESPRLARDTVVTSRTVVDTTIITMDTTVALDTTISVDTTFKVDTTRVRGGRGEVIDTAK
jgi:hypothetical protein